MLQKSAVHNSVDNAAEHVKHAREVAKKYAQKDKWACQLYKNGNKHLVMYKMKKGMFKVALERIQKTHSDDVWTIGNPYPIK